MMAIVLPWHSNPTWQPTQFRRFEAGMGRAGQVSCLIVDLTNMVFSDGTSKRLLQSDSVLP